ncbi:MAG: PBSX family phage terminase large subunit [Alphaproteobacteria bacterium]|nr:PBSX family phage terminase large subunit [Alphaproteobacteria bacterium]
MNVEIARAFSELLTEKKRYKLFYGGRAGGKSFAFADALLTLCMSKKLLIACVREVQSSIKDSVYKLIADRIAYYELSSSFRLYEDRIVNLRNGSKFIFKGIMEHNAQNIKSLEGVDICWVEEAQKISFRAWEVLDPTIRKEGAEIWLSMNREEEADPVFKALALKPDADTLVRKVNYYDNPYCPEGMKKLAMKAKASDLDEYLHIWEGEPRREAGNKLIGRADVFQAMENSVTIEAGMAPLIIGLDVARFGDDKTAFCLRRGRQVICFKTYEKLDVVTAAHTAAGMIAEYGPAKVCIDVGGLGAGVYDVLIAEGFADVVYPVNFGQKADYPERYVNKRAEMWARVRDWLKSPLAVSLPKMEGLAEDLTAPAVSFDSLGRMQLEAKAEIKKRIGRSTDVGDALALTFAIENAAFLLNGRGRQGGEFVDDGVYL